MSSRAGAPLTTLFPGPDFARSAAAAASATRSNYSFNVHPFFAAYHRCRRSFPAQLHPGHGKERSARLPLRETRVETSATRPSERASPIIRGPLRVLCSGLPPSFFLLASRSPFDTLFFVLENASAHHQAAIHAPESGHGNGRCESRDQSEASSTGKGCRAPPRPSKERLHPGMDTRRDGANGPGGTVAHRLQGWQIVRRSVPCAKSFLDLLDLLLISELCRWWR